MSRANPDPDWPWWVQTYFPEGHELAGQLELETKHASRVSQEIEIQAATDRVERGELGRVEFGMNAGRRVP